MPTTVDASSLQRSVLIPGGDGTAVNRIHWSPLSTYLVTYAPMDGKQQTMPLKGQSVQSGSTQHRN